MAEGPAPYRNEVDALRARRDDLEAELAAERAEVDRLRRALVEHASTPGNNAAARPAGGSRAALPSRLIMPQGTALFRSFVLLLFGILPGVALFAKPGKHFVGAVFCMVTFLPLGLWTLARELGTKRYLRLDAEGLEFKSYGRRVSRFAWADVEATRLAPPRGRGHGETVSLKVRGRDEWLTLDDDLLPGGRALVDLVERYRRG